MKLIDLYNKKVQQLANRAEQAAKELAPLLESLQEFTIHFENQTGVKLDPVCTGSWLFVSQGMYIYKFNFQNFLKIDMTTTKCVFKKELEEQDSPLDEFVYQLAKEMLND